MSRAIRSTKFAEGVGRALYPLLYFFVTGLLVIVPALWNQSPLVYSDSGAYIHRVWTLEAMTDRPMGYPLIMRAVSWQVSMWPVVFFQGMMTSWLLFEVLRWAFPKARKLRPAHLTLLIVLVLISSLPWYAAQLMPDALTAPMGLAIFLLLLSDHMGIVERAFLWICLFFFAISHLSHMAILMAVIPCLICARALPMLRVNMGDRFWRRWSGLVACCLATIFFVQEFNARSGYGRVLAPATDLFLAAKLCESGVMYEHLDRCCPKHDHPICHHMDQLDATAMFFIWNEDSPFRSEPYDQVAMSKAIAPITREVLNDPHNWPLIAWTTFTATLIQLSQVEVGAGLDPYGENSAPWYQYRLRLPHELPLYMNSLQQRGMLHPEELNRTAHIALLLSILFIALFWNAASPKLRVFFIGTFVILFLNAMVTGGAANVYDRLQARVTWLLVLSACLSALHRYRHHLMLEPSNGTEG